LEWCVIKIDALFFTLFCAVRSGEELGSTCLVVFLLFLFFVCFFLLFSGSFFVCPLLGVVYAVHRSGYVCVYFFLFFFLLVSLRGWQRTGCGRQRKDSAREQGRVASVNTFSARERERERERRRSRDLACVFCLVFIFFVVVSFVIFCVSRKHLSPAKVLLVFIRCVCSLHKVLL